MRRGDRIWTQEDDAFLRRCARDGMTTAQTAKALSVTRNMIIGRAWRIGVKFDPTLLDEDKAERSERCRKAALARWRARRESAAA